jgi:hypothetical protein
VNPVSEITPAHRGKLAKAVEIVGKAKPPKAAVPAPKALPKQAAPVRHAIPDFALWWRAWAAAQHQQSPQPGGHHGWDGGGHRHR